MLSTGILVVGSCGYQIRLFNRSGEKIKELTHYHDGRNMQYCVSADYLTVLADDTIVVSMCYSGNNHVLFLSEDLQCPLVVDVHKPWGLSPGPGGDDILLAAQSPSRICRLWGHKTGVIHQEVIMTFTNKDIDQFGEVKSVAVKDMQIAVVFEKAVVMYEWIQP